MSGGYIMKITKTRLKELIKEELKKIAEEQGRPNTTIHLKDYK